MSKPHRLLWLLLERGGGLCVVMQVELNEGPLDQFTHDMEPYLRKQGMPVRLNKGKDYEAGSSPPAELTGVPPLVEGCRCGGVGGRSHGLCGK